MQQAGGEGHMSLPEFLSRGPHTDRGNGNCFLFMQTRGFTNMAMNSNKVCTSLKAKDIFA